MTAARTMDDSLWPLGIIRIEGVKSDLEFGEILDQMQAHLESGDEFVCIFDMSHCGIPPVSQLRRYAQWLRSRDALLRAQVLGVATIITSAPVRLAKSFLNHLHPLPMPYTTVANMDGALRFVLGKLEEAGMRSEAERIRQEFALRCLQAVCVPVTSPRSL